MKVIVVGNGVPVSVIFVVEISIVDLIPLVGCVIVVVVSVIKCVGVVDVCVIKVVCPFLFCREQL